MDTATDIENEEQRLIEAIRQSDIGYLDRVLHEELVAMAPNGDIITKAMDLASHRAGEMVVDELRASIEHINVIGDTAVVTVLYHTKGKMLGQPIAGKYKYLRVWKKFGQGFKVIAATCFKV
jgi:ketosteroid isomerase-like protein